jgi:hypothetical protein
MVKSVKHGTATHFALRGTPPVWDLLFLLPFFGNVVVSVIILPDSDIRPHHNLDIDRYSIFGSIGYLVMPMDADPTCFQGNHISPPEDLNLYLVMWTHGALTTAL